MSGTYDDGQRAGAAAERARLLAFLAARHRAQATVAQQYPRPELNELAEDRRRQLEVLIEEIEAELHLAEPQAAAAEGE